MTTPDLINGMFEFLGSVAIWSNVWALHKDKGYRGVRLAPTAFFMTWGFWNLYFYPHLGQLLSLVGACSITLANTVWVVQMVYYTPKAAREKFIPGYARYLRRKREVLHVESM